MAHRWSTPPYGRPSSATKRALNDFRYSEDPRGQRCPIGAHCPPGQSARQQQSRRGKTDRIWRRSLTYGGDFLPYDSPGDGKSRGLLFISYARASISSSSSCRRGG